MTNCRKNALLKKIMALNFAVNDLALYLDTHPSDSQALYLHNQYAQESNKLTKKYEEYYGPLTINCIQENNWQWSEGNWPWERSMM